ncbi:hypothetical protein BAG01nite_48140 [Brevibacillus agri]|uniref:Uncharacterized protein n=1 Tax=Brevibacillus agri TaxID=51101 RepID=A0A3M8B7Q6_9BACL|nr:MULTISPECIES: hypothetical protein [Brevibacillus]ELK41938.1 hypothetical protein D478_11017 [Brevibacillus agri BAB-2500]EJL43401.1 hypothetical protein PMI08_02647 [Brevibacillus sp. CF112]MBG9565295.1 hypothetical protein [Brevibacillus agri]MCG5251808.1 hypothetical protein [Brevibacillus agri]MDN4092791.1 hypothetical protein [Brevibacillus agri]
MKLFKRISVFMVGLSLAVGTFIPSTHAISDYDKRSYNLSGTTVSYIQDTVYSDTQCGSSAKAVFTATSPSSLTEIGMDYKVYGLFYPDRVVDSQSTLLKNSARASLVSKVVYDFYRAYAAYTFNKNGSYWKPTSETFNCAEYSLRSAEQHPSSFTIDGISEQAESLATDELVGKTNKHTVAEFLLADQSPVLEEYGLTLKDLKLSKKPTVKKNVKKFEDVETGVVFENNEESTFKVFNFKPIKGKKDGQKYEILAYAVVDETTKRVDKGLIINKQEK